MRVKFIAELNLWWTHGICPKAVDEFWDASDGLFANEPMKFLRAFFETFR